MERTDFNVSKFYTYSGPSYYLDRPSVVFNLYLSPSGPDLEFYKEKIVTKFPKLKDVQFDKVVDLFCAVLLNVTKMDLDLFINRYAIFEDGDEWTIGIESLDHKLTKECVYFTSDWLLAINSGESFDFDGNFATLQHKFDRCIYGGPTIYSLVEGGVKRNIPVHYLFEENQFQWGYGKKQHRGRSTIFHTDGIKDTEFTTYKDMVGEFLELCGLPTPKGKNCFTEEEILAECESLGWPVVIKPVAGHKGIGVTTGIQSVEEAKKAFNLVIKGHDDEGSSFEGALVQKMIFGYDHRILTIGGKFAACLKREPAFVIGDGKSTIKQLINADNELEIRADTARSPLCKIKLDDVMQDFLVKQGLTPESIPQKDEKIVLRRVANISAGGVSFNVTDQMHPKNIELAENIAKFFNVTAMGIDVLSADISKPWTEGNFGIIEINAGPGVFMHLAPAFGGSIDIPAKIMEHFYGKNFLKSRIPIITGNYLTQNMIEKVYAHLKDIKPDVEFGSVRRDGLYFNNVFFNDHYHDENCKMLFRNPKLEIAMIEHNRDDIHDYGIWHIGHDIAILDQANYAEKILKRDLLSDGLLIEIKDVRIDIEGEKEVFEMDDKDYGKYETLLVVTKAGKEIKHSKIAEGEDMDDVIFNILQPYLEEILYKYE